MRARTPPDDGLFEAVFRAAEAETHVAGTSAELYERRGVSFEWTEDDEGVRVTEARERGFALRLFRAGRVAFAAEGPENATRLVGEARTLLPRARTRRGSRAASPLANEPRETAALGDPPPADENAARDALAAFRQAVLSGSRGSVQLRDAAVSLGERRERLATSSGRSAAWSVRAASLVATVVGRAAASRFSARVVSLGERPVDLPVARLARLAIDRVLLPLTGSRVEAGRADLLLDPHVAAHLVGRLAPLFLGDSHEPVLFARTRGGRDPLASAAVTLVDDPAVLAGPVKSLRDAEGTPVSKTVLIEAGQAMGRLTDVAAAARLSTTPSGNAFRRSWSTPPEIGITNFFIDPKNGVSARELLAAVAKGFYAAVLLERPDVDLAADRFRLVTAGYVVEKGLATDRVSELILEGKLSAFLRGIEAIGNDLKFMVGAGGGVGSPTLFVPKWK